MRCRWCAGHDDEYGSTAQVGLFLHVKTDPCYNAQHGQFIHTNITETWVTGSCPGSGAYSSSEAFRAYCNPKNTKPK